MTFSRKIYKIVKSKLSNFTDKKDLHVATEGTSGWGKSYQG